MSRARFRDPVDPLAEGLSLLEPPSAPPSLREYLLVLRRGWKMLALAVLLGGCAALVHYSVTPAQYRAAAILQIERRTLMAVIGADGLQLDAGDAEAFFQTQYELLRSRGLAERVVRQLGLGNAVLFSPRPSTAGRGPQPSAEGDAARVAELADRLLANLDVEPLGKTYLVRLSYVAPDGQLATTIVNALVDAYIDWGIETRSDTAGRASGFLGSQIAGLKQEIRDKELELHNYSRSIDVIGNAPASNQILQQLEALNRNYSAAVAQRIDAEARYRELAVSPAEPLVEAGAGDALRQLEQQLQQREQEYTNKAKVYKADWPAMRDLDSEIGKLRQRVRSVVAGEVGKVRTAARVDYQTALRRQEHLAAELVALKAQALQQGSATVGLNNLEVEIATRRSLLDELLRKQSETEVASRLQSTRDSNVRVVDRAVVPRARFRPSLRYDLAHGLGIGLLLGLAVVLTRAYFDRSVKTPEDVDRVLSLPLLAAIPALGADREDAPRYGMARAGNGAGREGSARKQAPRIELIPYDEPRLAASESYRTLRTALLLASAHQVKSVAVISAQPEEGKSATVANLGVVLAQLGRRVLVIDADMRKPRLHEIFDVSNRHGLAHYLANGIDLEQIFKPTRVGGLYVCTAGPIPPNPSELLAAGRMARLLELSRTHFDYVIVDTPPALVVTDATLVGALVDGTILCLRAGQVLREDARACLDRLLLAETRVLGVVLNCFRPDDGRGRRYYSGYDQEARNTPGADLSRRRREEPTPRPGGSTHAKTPDRMASARAVVVAPRDEPTIAEVVR